MGDAREGRVIAADLQCILAELGDFFLEREKTLRNVVLSLLTSSHHFLLGPVGAGKTNLLESLTARITGAHFFGVQLDAQMSKDDLFGPIDIVRFERDNVWERDVTGYLPWAHLALLDEPGKAGTSTLTPMLRVMNERRFRNGKIEMRLPLVTIVGGSNEMLDPATLAATWDRFLIREEVSYLHDPDNVRRLLRASTPDVGEAHTITLADLQVAQGEVARVTVPVPVEDSLIDIRGRLHAEGVMVSDRRLRASLGLLRAAAWLAGRTDVDAQDLIVLTDVLWNALDERATVTDVVLAHTGAALAQVREVEEVMESVAREIRERSRLGEVALRTYAPDARLKLRRARSVLTDLSAEPSAQRALRRWEAVDALMRRECFGVDVAAGNARTVS